MRLAGVMLVLSVCAGCAVTRVGEPEWRAPAEGAPATEVEIQRYAVTGVLPGGGAIRLTGRDDTGGEVSPALRAWVAPMLISTGAVALNVVLIGTPTIWHLVAGRPDYLPTPDRWCLTTLVGTCRVTVESDVPAISSTPSTSTRR